MDRKDIHSPIAGIKIGVIIMDTSHPLLPGNVQNALSFNFPVIYEIVSGINFTQLMMGDESCDDPIKQAISNLENKGVNIIFGACGSFANWQTRARSYAEVPIYLSIMAQVPFILTGLPQKQKLGVMFATTKAFTDRVKSECNIKDIERLIIFGAEEVKEFNDFFKSEATLEDGIKLTSSIVELCIRKKKENPEIGAWLFQCSELPVYAAAVQTNTGLPVYDQTLLITSQEAAFSRHTY